MKEGDAKRTRKMEWKGREGKRAIKERQDGERGPVQDLAQRAVLDLSPGAVGMSMSGSRRGPLSRTPAT